jgi:nucleoside-triphosphatase
VNVKSRHRVGKYGVDVQSFETFLESLHLKAPAGSLIVMDEIGKMECFSAAFVSLARELLDGAGGVVATVALKGPDFISEVKRRSDVVIYEVTERNRDSLAERLALDIQAALRSVRVREA